MAIVDFRYAARRNKKSDALLAAVINRASFVPSIRTPEGGAATMILWLDLCGIHRAEDLWAEAPALIDRHLIEASLPA